MRSRLHHGGLWRAALYSLIDYDELCSTIETKILNFKAVTLGTPVCDTRVIHKSKRITALESEIKHKVN